MSNTEDRHPTKAVTICHDLSILYLLTQTHNNTNMYLYITYYLKETMEEDVRLTIVINEILHKRLKMYCVEQDQAMRYIVSKAITEYLAKRAKRDPRD